MWSACNSVRVVHRNELTQKTIHHAGDTTDRKPRLQYVIHVHCPSHQHTQPESNEVAANMRSRRQRRSSALWACLMSILDQWQFLVGITATTRFYSYIK